MNTFIGVLSVKISCLYRQLLYKNSDFHLNLGFNFSAQTLLFTLNWIHVKVISTDNGFTLKSNFTKRFSTQTVSLPNKLTN